MTRTYDIAVLVGSLRKASFSRRTAQALMQIAPPSLKMEIVEISDLPLYNQDLDEGESAPPAAWTAFRERIRRADGLLFITPEYNRSVPSVLKNAIDVGSRPYGKSAWAGGKPGAVISVSPGAIGGFGANHHLRQSLVFLDVLPMQQPEAYLGGVAKWFDDAGKLQDESARKFLQTIIDAYAAWVERIAGSK
jgi:chromate reductase